MSIIFIHHSNTSSRTVGGRLQLQQKKEKKTADIHVVHNKTRQQTQQSNKKKNRKLGRKCKLHDVPGKHNSSESDCEDQAL